MVELNGEQFEWVATWVIRSLTTAFVMDEGEWRDPDNDLDRDMTTAAGRLNVAAQLFIGTLYAAVKDGDIDPTRWNAYRDNFGE